MQAIVAYFKFKFRTPGRLIDLFEEDSNLCDLSDIGFLVLDEADRMLDQGFEEAIKNIISKLPKVRQTVMFSATW
jgi:ATP-dependent RNA helicase DBP3